MQAAEKLHAYSRTYEGGRVSSRAKDLVDLALIAHLFTLDADQLRRAIEDEFAARATHKKPQHLPPSPEQWREPFGQLAAAVGLDRDLDVGRGAAAAMFDPILKHQIQAGTWSPETQQWTNITTS
ncbi:nucleotidyl transferase AbiEii/AbiGii toxin family protein [Phytoactinopolyspora limicola]|uniref:nucleotidyl transferase AbiEii/AbiGii toxin family protein n=1 Tax=Phytoactinopolyspora limicola TaxID=2715536 RepID=UPI0014088207|nr:nucleotidyl transferase AbiEii/AbiGii toxin family protein [Phytoactinopolyspora limicola]